jgi:hypothetical protein
MDLRTEILKEHSKAQAQKIADWIGNNSRRFASLIHLFLADEYRVIQRAAWIISLVADKHPSLLQRHLDQMIHKMQEPDLPTAVKRNFVRILQDIKIPEPLHGIVMESCFKFFADPRETIAVRVFSMTVLANLSKYYPEIKEELKLTIEEGLSQKPTAAYRSRAREVLKTL